jgi:hypothetical protein
VKGHGAYETALRRGWDVPIEIPAYSSQAEETRDLLADKCLSELAETDDDKLRALLGELQADVSFSGFTEAEVDELLEKLRLAPWMRDS